jgi:formylmethanofuran dehydrogenase subunit E
MTQEDPFSKEDFRRCSEFHGHICPGLAIGYQATKAALSALEEQRAADEEMVATVETDACGTDAVQVLSGCTLGKGNLMHKDHGKHVYTIVSRNSGEGVRLALKAGVMEVSDRHRELIQKIRTGEATDPERTEFWDLHHAKTRELLAKNPEELFDVRKVTLEPPPKAVMEPSKPCDQCGEPTMQSKLVERQGKRLCRECGRG